MVQGDFDDDDANGDITLKHLKFATRFFIEVLSRAKENQPLGNFVHLLLVRYIYFFARLCLCFSICFFFVLLILH